MVRDGPASRSGNRHAMSNVLYVDKLIAISDDSLLFRHFYLPVGPTTIPLNAIETIEIVAPSLLSGKWRIHGTGDFRTWFPRDLERPKRDRLFVLFRRKYWWRIGFTVENANDVQRIFSENGFIQNDAER
jgi:hypothetical protein